MNDLSHAISILKASSHTCVLVKEDRTLTSDQRGISPMLDFLLEGRDLRDFSAADRIIGKGAAMLFALAGIRNLYGEVVSQGALDFCQHQGLHLEYDLLVPQIINRAQDGPCPMEETVEHIQEARDAFPLLLEKRNQLRNRSHADTN